ncbi:hypothetical protein KDJ56_10035 [Brevibacillus composti]|uniref:Membrane protein YkvI n=1 Tax=Brevibacillus composti TaxID=2796470 RepID=A0A7T5EP91_9BACL|nr:hypothetical protein [Brevibacillus composti]QQE76223.1 hypothetical protein JD108_10340 [Brevibacillus composti]QUO43252.1 hypothetical protein KDJ56_10035 [Brevibacillus composti]
MQHSWKAALQIAFTYIGTVVGAGFASGKEIVEFFVQYGSQGLVGILLATVLFCWGGVRVMVLSYRIQADSYQDLSTYLFGRPIGTVFHVILLLVLFGTTSVMLAATGAVFWESFGLSPQIGILASMLLIFFVAQKGLRAIHSVNSLFVPLLIGFTALVFLIAKPWLETGPLVEINKPFAWLSSPLYYVALNVALTQAVLVPIGRHSDSEKPLVWGGILGGVGVGLLLLLSYSAMLVRMPSVGQAEMPMIALLQGLGAGIPLIYAVLVYSEIFSTLVANVFGLSEQVKKATGLKRETIVAGILCIGYAISFVGFGPLLRLLYPLFGQLVMLFLLMLAIQQLRRKPA